ncbi:hypothetical protein, partial [Devosia psychrophila]
MMDTATGRPAWIVKPRNGFTSFKTTKAIEYKERWPRDVLIQATLSPEIETLSPFEVTLPPTSIQPEGDSGGCFGRSGRGELRGLAQSWSLSGAADPVA